VDTCTLVHWVWRLYIDDPWYKHTNANNVDTTLTSLPFRGSLSCKSFVDMTGLESSPYPS